MAEEEKNAADEPLSPLWFAAGAMLGGMAPSQAGTAFPVLAAGLVLAPEADAEAARVTSPGRPDQITTSRLVEP